MSRTRPRSWPLTSISLVFLLGGVAGFLFDDDLMDMGRSLRDWQTYLLSIVTGAMLLLVALHARRKHRRG